MIPKQAQSLLIASNLGYYRFPRQARFEDISRKVGVPRTTYEDHVRKAENKIINAVAPYLSIYFGKTVEDQGSQSPRPSAEKRTAITFE